MLAVAERVAVRRGALEWWHLLSLDAPAVAGLWTWFAGRGFGVNAPRLWPLAMFVAVWALYAGDRLLDARAGVGLEARHRFHWEHRRGFLAGIAACGVGLAGLVAWVPAEYWVLGVALAGWLCVVHLRNGKPLPKEWAVGGFFWAAVFLPVARSGPALLAGAGFGLLCTVNCLYIHAWEHPYSSARDTHAWTLWGLRRLDWLVSALMLAALLLRQDVLVAEGLAAAALWGLNRARAQMGRTTLRAAADVALLTPLLALPWMR